MKLVLSLLVLAACGAQQVKIEPVKIEPIHMTIDVNLHDGPDTATTSTKTTP